MTLHMEMAAKAKSLALIENASGQSFGANGYLLSMR